MEVKTKKIKLPNTIVLSILWTVIGIILLIWPGQSLDVVCRIVGIIVLITGMIMVITGIIGAGVMPGGFGTVIGAITAVIGLVVAINPGLIVSILPFVAGIFLIIHCVTSLVQSFELAGAHYRYWWIAVLISVLGIGLGVILLCNAHSTAAFIARIIGIFLIYGGISNIWIASRRSYAAKLKKQEEEALDVEAKITDI